MKLPCIGRSEFIPQGGKHELAGELLANPLSGREPWPRRKVERARVDGLPHVGALQSGVPLVDTEVFQRALALKVWACGA